jgi:site-specific DNA-methyltransferase (adenine-specific)
VSESKETVPVNQIICGDCLNVMRDWPDKCVDLIVTSPPYNLKKKWWKCSANGCMPKVAKKFTEHWYPDEIPEEAYQKKQKALIAECLRIGPCVAYNHKVRYAFKREGRAFHPMDWIDSRMLWVEIVWDRGGGITFNSRRPIVADERIFVLGRPKAWTHLGLTTVWRIPPDSDPNPHPCAFPVKVPLWLIGSFTRPGDIIVDPMCGSGTTCVAAKMLGRRYIGIDISEDYCRIARERLQAVETGVPVKEARAGQRALFDPAAIGE